MARSLRLWASSSHSYSTNGRPAPSRDVAPGAVSSGRDRHLKPVVEVLVDGSRGRVPCLRRLALRCWVVRRFRRSHVELDGPLRGAAVDILHCRDEFPVALPEREPAQLLGMGGHVAFHTILLGDEPEGCSCDGVPRVLVGVARTAALQVSLTGDHLPSAPAPKEGDLLNDWTGENHQQDKSGENAKTAYQVFRFWFWLRCLIL